MPWTAARISLSGVPGGRRAAIFCCARFWNTAPEMIKLKTMPKYCPVQMNPMADMTSSGSTLNWAIEYEICPTAPHPIPMRALYPYIFCTEVEDLTSASVAAVRVILKGLGLKT